MHFISELIRMTVFSTASTVRLLPVFIQLWTRVRVRVREPSARMFVVPLWRALPVWASSWYHWSHRTGKGGETENHQYSESGQRKKQLQCQWVNVLIVEKQQTWRPIHIPPMHMVQICIVWYELKVRRRSYAQARKPKRSLTSWPVTTADRSHVLKIQLHLQTSCPVEIFSAIIFNPS